MEPNPRGVLVICISVALGVIDTLAVIVRFIARRKSESGLAMDDWFIAMSLVPAYFMIMIAGFWVSKGGAGRHTDTLTPSQVTLILKLIIPASVTYALTITLVKVSVLLLYRRIFVTPYFRVATLVVGVVSIIWGIITILGQIFLCRPISAAWDPNSLFTDKCMNVQAYLRGVTISNLLIDVIILCLPIYMVLKLQLPFRKKIVVAGIFMVGGLSCVASIVRAINVQAVKTNDIAYAIVYRYIWSHIEPATAILCACLATYRPLFVNLHLRLPSVLSGKLGSTNRTTWNESKTGRMSHSSSSGAATGNDLERRSLTDNYPLEYVQINESNVEEDPFKPKSPAKRQYSERTIPTDVMTTPAEREGAWQGSYFASGPS